MDYHKKLDRIAEKVTQEFDSIIDSANPAFIKLYSQKPPVWFEILNQEIDKIFIPKVPEHKRDEMMTLALDDKMERTQSDFEIGQAIGSAHALMLWTKKNRTQLMGVNSLLDKISNAEEDMQRVLFRYLSDSNSETRDAFILGFDNGMAQTIDSNGNIIGANPTFNLTLFLLTSWPFVIKMNSLKELYNHVYGKLYFGDEQSFYDYCKRRKIKLAKRGRPRK